MTPQLHHIAELFARLWALALYGMSDILGNVPVEAGDGNRLAFLFAMCAAAMTGFNYAEFVSRHPRSAGEARYTQNTGRVNQLASHVT